MDVAGRAGVGLRRYASETNLDWDGAWSLRSLAVSMGDGLSETGAMEISENNTLLGRKEFGKNGVSMWAVRGVLAVLIKANSEGRYVLDTAYTAESDAEQCTV